MKILNNLIVFVTFGCALFIFTSCGDTKLDTQKVELEIQLFKNPSQTITEKYPEDIQTLSQPLKIGNHGATCALYPLHIKRLDLNKEFTINYLDKTGNDKKIAFVIKKHGEYFENNLVDSLLVSSKKGGVDIAEVLKNALNKPNYFIMSSNDNLKLEGKVVYTSTNDIQIAMSKYIAESKPTKIVILYHPELKATSNRKTSIRVEENKSNTAGLTEIKTQSEEDLSKNVDDYMALYTLSLVNVYLSKDHHISFNYLRQAVESAIRSGKANELSIVIGKDLQEGQKTHNAVWKMSTHDDDWRPIMELLSSNGKSKVGNTHAEKKGHF